MRDSLSLGVILCSWVLATASGAHAQESDRIIHLGARAPGTVTVTKVHTTYSLHFSGDEEIEYQIDVRDVDVYHGAVRVYERYSDSWPLWSTGVGWRDATGGDFAPPWLQGHSVLSAQSMTADSVILDYLDTPIGSSPRHRRHTFQLVGKSLRVRVQDLDHSTAWRSNYCGLNVGPTHATERPIYVPIQGGLLTPMTMFKNGEDHYFLGNMLDMFTSNSADWNIDQQGHLTPSSTSFRFTFDTYNMYKRSSADQISGPLDETLNITISHKLRDVLATPTQPASPYRKLLTGRTVAILSGASWTDYVTLWNDFAQWGIDDIVGYYFAGWSSSANDPPLNQNVGPDWYPARDPTNFATMITQGRNRGFMLAGYMAFNQMPYSAPPATFDPARIAKTDMGIYKLNAQSNIPSVAETASAYYAAHEANLVKSNYGMNMGYLDVQTYAGPSRGADGDHIDQIQGSGWARTLGQAISDRKHWMRQMSDILEGPLLGESSISTGGASFELLWAGYCDSLQRVINTGAGLPADQQPLGSTTAPTSWPVIPEYEQYVFSRLQCNHGNGYGARFFSRNDGPQCVDMTTGATRYPLTELALDRYRIYEITYGKSAFVFTNGPYNGNGNYTDFSGLIKEHYMMNALQKLYYDGAARSIQYLWNGQLSTFEQVFGATETLDSFRNPEIKLSFSNGLQIWLNHAPTPWSVNAGGVAYTIPEDGFVAVQTGTPFVCFSAIPPGTGGNRIDYCYAPGRWEFFDGRGVVNSWGGIDTQGIKHLRLQNFVHNTTVWATSNGNILTTQGTPPNVVRVDILPANATFAPGTSAGFQAIATLSNGAWRDVTTLVTWSSSNTAVAHVNNGAALTALASGSTTVTTTPFGGAPVFPAHVQVQ